MFTDDDRDDRPSSWWSLMGLEWRPLKTQKQEVRQQTLLPVNTDSWNCVCVCITDASNLHPRTSQSSESWLSSRTWSLCPEERDRQMSRQTCEWSFRQMSHQSDRVEYLLPPVALSLMCKAVIPSSLQRWATSWAANMAAYGEDSSLSAFTFIPPVTRQMVSLETRWTQSVVRPNWFKE